MPRIILERERFRIAKVGKDALSTDERDMMFSERGASAKLLMKGLLTNAAFSTYTIAGLPTQIRSRYRRAVINFPARAKPPLVDGGGMRDSENGFYFTKYLVQWVTNISGTTWSATEPEFMMITTTSSVEIYTILNPSLFSAYFYVLWENEVE